MEILTQQEKQLELYLEEKQDLLKVKEDKPYPLRSACSESFLASPDDEADDPGYPTRTASTSHLTVNPLMLKPPKKGNPDFSEESSDEENGSYSEVPDSLMRRVRDESFELESPGKSTDSMLDSWLQEQKRFARRKVIDGDEDEDEKLIQMSTSREKNAEDTLQSNLEAIDHQAGTDHTDTKELTTEDFSWVYNKFNQPTVTAIRPSRGRTRTRVGHTINPPSPLNISSDSVLTEAAASVTARLYKSPSPKPELEGKYLKSKRERISSPLSSPVFPRKNTKLSSYRTLSSSSEREGSPFQQRQSPSRKDGTDGSNSRHSSPDMSSLNSQKPKFNFLRRGSGTKAPKIISRYHQKSTSKDVSPTKEFDYLRKGSGRYHSSGDVQNLRHAKDEADIEKHDYLRRSKSELSRSERHRKDKSSEESPKFDYLRRKPDLTYEDHSPSRRRERDSPSRILQDSEENLPKHKFLKKGSMKQPYFQRSADIPSRLSSPESPSPTTGRKFVDFLKKSDRIQSSINIPKDGRSPSPRNSSPSPNFDYLRKGRNKQSSAGDVTRIKHESDTPEDEGHKYLTRRGWNKSPSSSKNSKEKDSEEMQKFDYLRRKPGATYDGSSSRKPRDKETSPKRSLSSDRESPTHKFLKKGTGKQLQRINSSKTNSPSDVSTSNVKTKLPSNKVTKEPQKYRSKSSEDLKNRPNVGQRSRARLVSSMTSLAIVPESSVEDQEAANHDRNTAPNERIPLATSLSNPTSPLSTFASPSSYLQPTLSNNSDMSNPPVKRRQKKGFDRKKDEWKRHSHPEGRGLASALAQYTEDIETGLGGRDNIINLQTIADSYNYIISKGPSDDDDGDVAMDSESSKNSSEQLDALDHIDLVGADISRDLPDITVTSPTDKAFGTSAVNPDAAYAGEMDQNSKRAFHLAQQQQLQYQQHQHHPTHGQRVDDISKDTFGNLLSPGGRHSHDHDHSFSADSLDDGEMSSDSISQFSDVTEGTPHVEPITDDLPVEPTSQQEFLSTQDEEWTETMEIEVFPLSDSIAASLNAGTLPQQGISDAKKDQIGYQSEDTSKSYNSANIDSHNTKGTLSSEVVTSDFDKAVIKCTPSNTAEHEGLSSMESHTLISELPTDEIYNADTAETPRASNFEAEYREKRVASSSRTLTSSPVTFQTRRQYVETLKSLQKDHVESQIKQNSNIHAQKKQMHPENVTGAAAIDENIEIIDNEENASSQAISINGNDGSRQSINIPQNVENAELISSAQDCQNQSPSDIAERVDLQGNRKLVIKFHQPKTSESPKHMLMSPTDERGNVLSDARGEMQTPDNSTSTPSYSLLTSSGSTPKAITNPEQTDLKRPIVLSCDFDLDSPRGQEQRSAHRLNDLHFQFYDHAPDANRTVGSRSESVQRAEDSLRSGSLIGSGQPEPLLSLPSDYAYTGSADGTYRQDHLCQKPLKIAQTFHHSSPDTCAQIIFESPNNQDSSLSGEHQVYSDVADVIDSSQHSQAVGGVEPFVHHGSHFVQDGRHFDQQSSHFDRLPPGDQISSSDVLEDEHSQLSDDSLTSTHQQIQVLQEMLHKLSPK